ncbi:hypothetical protein LPTSP3_g02890 [Leptospira kobayashii]|uniref:YvaD family protein n=1 Tax=Leptospira kobayashii TaxID=1917830 RepID=A0ABM7UFK8_9LEPT|nr:DUF5360 family protein [Leptospira kobayashii]BDA77359.1 hypothetical protein LPTSP3_g02890 [Leptospira kobayashii]
MKTLRPFFLITDIGFVLYWLITILHIIPDEWLFKDYTNPLLVSWNWSFLPLDLLISFSGLLSLHLYGKANAAWKPVSLISLVLTFSSGLQAIAFWGIRLDFDITWWLPNLYLLLYPIYFIRKSVKGELV